ncbi:MAG: carboxypeptidase regulatory-like domain-containing protein [Flammeovirgaceae bacterium]|nr:carboxypeptidase regulatory-like domain-containing protein [Flammeovirgaceae bacterium]
MYAFIIISILLTNEVEFLRKEGIRGKVYWISENQMPGPGQKRKPDLGIERELYIHDVTTIDQVEGKDGFYSSIQTPLVIKVMTKRNGTFKINLPPGTYSVFTKEPQGFYANLLDHNKQINPVTVHPRKFSWISITVDY